MGLSGFFPVPGNKPPQTIQSYVPPCQTHSETRWDEEEPGLHKAPAAFNAPPTDRTRAGTQPLPSPHPSQYFTEKTPAPWPQGYGEPLLLLYHSWKLMCRLETKQHLLQKGLASLEPAGRSVTELQHHNGLQPTAGWGCSSFLDSQ